MKVTQSIHLMQDGDAFSNGTEDEADLTVLNIFYLEIVALILKVCMLYAENRTTTKHEKRNLKNPSPSTFLSSLVRFI